MLMQMNLYIIYITIYASVCASVCNYKVYLCQSIVYFVYEYLRLFRYYFLCIDSDFSV